VPQPQPSEHVPSNERVQGGVLHLRRGQLWALPVGARHRLALGHHHPKHVASELGQPTAVVAKALCHLLQVYEVGEVGAPCAKSGHHFGLVTRRPREGHKGDARITTVKGRELRKKGRPHICDSSKSISAKRCDGERRGQLGEKKVRKRMRSRAHLKKC